MKKKKRKREAEGKPKPKSNFQEYLEMEMGGAVSMEEDLEMERKLEKKLKVKKGKLGGPDDGMDELFADCRCLTTDSLSWGYPGQYVRASAYAELDG